MTTESDNDLNNENDTAGNDAAYELPSEEQPSEADQAHMNPVLRILILLAVCAVLGVIVWDGICYASFKMTMSCLQNELNQHPEGDGERMQFLDLPNSDCFYGAPEHKQESYELGKSQVSTYTWPGLLMNYGPMHVIYGQEDPFLRVIEIRSGPLKKAEKVESEE